LRQSKNITYKGVLDYSIVSIEISKYFALLFPTYYHGEGFAGCLIDAFFAGLPIIATDWLYNKEILKEGINALIVKPKDSGDLAKAIIILYNNRTLAFQMASNNYKKSFNYDVNTVFEPFILLLRNDKKGI
jgi:glycosyltransferase involved in cell wall biosynthesis